MIIEHVDKIGKKGIIIYGTGRKAALAFNELTHKGAIVIAFADQKSHRTDYTFAYNKKVISESDLIQYKDDCDIVIASNYWREISDRLNKIGIKKVYISTASVMSVKVEEGYLVEAYGNMFDRETYYVLCPYNIGDAIFWISAIKLFKKKNSFKKVCVIVKESLRNLAILFPSVDQVIASDILRDQMNVFSLEERVWELKNYYWAHVRMDDKYHQIGSPDGNVMGQDFNLLPGIKLREALGDGVWIDGKFERPNIKLCVEVDSKKILLMPYVNSSEQINPSFWVNLSSRLRILGYEVYTNCGKDEDPIKGTLKENGAIVDVLKKAGTYKAIIASRSGMCDLFAMMMVSDLMIIYNDEDELNKFDARIIWGNDNVKNFIASSHEDEVLESILMQI